MVRTKPSAGIDAGHPLDPLSESEVALASEILRKEKRLGPHARFTHVQLEEPARSDVLGWKPAAALPRQAAVTLFDSKTGATHVATVDLGSKRVTAWREYSTRAHPYGQPPIMIEEVFKVGDIVKADAGWRRAMKRRGLDDNDIELIQVDPFSAGYFDREVEKGRRLVSAVSYWRKDLKDNGYAHPIEGVVALVDLIENRVVDLVDEPDVDSDPEDIAQLRPRPRCRKPRTDLKPLDVVQPEGPSFAVDGWEVAWQNWRFRVGFTAARRAGAAPDRLSATATASGRSSTAPASPRWSSPTATRPPTISGRTPSTPASTGSASSPTRSSSAATASATSTTSTCRSPTITAQPVDHAERDLHARGGLRHPLEALRIPHRHASRCAGRAASSSRFFATVGNYDYGFFWYFYQDGTIQLEVKLTGIIQTAAVDAGRDLSAGAAWCADRSRRADPPALLQRPPAHGCWTAAATPSPSTSSCRGRGARDNPYGNVFDTTRAVLSRERDAVREADGRTGRYWKITNPNRKNSVGGPTATSSWRTARRLMLAQEGSYMTPRGGFATKHLWVTRYEPDERYASGEFPNQHAGGDGLPEYVEQNRSIEKPGYRGLAQFRPHPCLQARRLSGDAGRICRLHAEAERLLCRESGDGLAARPKQREPRQPRQGSMLRLKGA